MKFHEIAQLLEICKGEHDRSNAEFVVTLTNNIMKEPPEGETDEDYNPVSGLVPRTRENYYAGKPQLGSEYAKVILHRLDKTRFQKYIHEKLSEDALAIVSKKLQQFGINVAVSDVPATCAELMVQAITECSERKRRSKATQKSEKDKKEPPVPKNMEFAKEPLAKDPAPIEPKSIIRRYVLQNKTTPPSEIAEKEMYYVTALFEIYGESESVEAFSKDNLKDNFQLREHFKRQRRDFMLPMMFEKAQGRHIVEMSQIILTS